MSAVTRTISSTGTAAPIVLDRWQSPFNVSYSVALSGSATYGVEFTLDDPNGSFAPVWMSDANNGAGTVANAVGNYAFPVRAMRLNVTALTGSIRLNVIQGTTA